MADYSAIGNYVYETFILPALDRGKEQAKVPVAEVWRGLKGKHGMVAIHTVLSSKRFKEAYFLNRSDAPPAPNSLPVEYTFDLQRLRFITTSSPASSPPRSNQPLGR